MLHILAILVFTAVSNIDEVSLLIETYNGKEAGNIFRTHGKIVGNDQIFTELIDKGKKQASMMILGLTSILRNVLKPYNTRVYLSVGLVAVGTTSTENGNEEEEAIIEFKVFEWGPKISNFKQNKVSEIFKITSPPSIAKDIDSDDDSNDSSYEEEKNRPILGLADNANSPVRLAHNALSQSRRNADFYHIGGGAFSVTQSSTVTTRPEKNSVATLSFKPESSISRAQSYLPGLRNSTGNQQPYLSVKMDNNNVLDVKALAASIEDFKKESDKRISNLKDSDARISSRLELTALVRQPTDGIMTLEVMKKDCLLLIGDVNQILQERVTGRPASSITDKMTFNVDAIYGIGQALVEMVGEPDSVKTVNRVDQLIEFEEILKALISVVSTFWSGKILYKNSLSYSSLLSIFAGRPLFSPFCHGIQEILQNTLCGEQDVIYDNLKINTQSKALAKKLENGRWWYENPLGLLKSHSSTTNNFKNDKSSMCMLCYHVFNTNNKESDDIKLHPCKVLDHTDIENTDSVRVQVHLAKEIASLNPDQRSILEAVLAKKNVILVAAAGCGKTHLLKLIAMIYQVRVSPQYVIVTALFNNIALDIHGVTFNSFFKLGILSPNLEGVFAFDKDHNIEEFIRTKFNDLEGFSKLSRIRNASLLIIDEVTFSLFLHSYFFLF